jgi:hypothetical protein
VEEQTLQGRVKGCSQIWALAPATKRAVYTNRKTAIALALGSLSMCSHGNQERRRRHDTELSSLIPPSLGFAAGFFVRHCIAPDNFAVAGEIKRPVNEMIQGYETRGQVPSLQGRRSSLDALTESRLQGLRLACHPYRFSGTEKNHGPTSPADLKAYVPLRYRYGVTCDSTAPYGRKIIAQYVHERRAFKRGARAKCWGSSQDTTLPCAAEPALSVVEWAGAQRSGAPLKKCFSPANGRMLAS